MNAILDWLFGLEGLGFGDDGVVFEFARPFPAWIWAVVAPALITIAALGYRHVRVNKQARLWLVVLRSLTLLLIMVLLAGPRLVRPNERVEPDRVIVLADRSASMSIADAGTPGSRNTRESQLVSALEELAVTLEQGSQDREIVNLGFSSGVFEIDPTDLDEPDGSRTLLGRSLSSALRSSAGRPIAGVVVLSDGRSFDDVSAETMRSLAGGQIPVFVTPLGSSDRVPDIAIERVSAPALAFTKDRVPISVDLAGEAQTPTRVEIIDERTGAVLAESLIAAGDRTATLPIDAPGEGRRPLTVRLVPDGEDLLSENNSRSLELEFIDRPVRVLYLEGYPRWDYRYLISLMSREESVRVAALLLSNRFQYIQEGDAPVTTIPETPEAWEPFDVVIVGDLRPELLGENRLAQLRDHVAERGAGLIWLGGTGPTPDAWADTALGPLLPMTIDRSAASGIAIYDEPATLLREPAAVAQGLLALEPDGTWPDRMTQPETGWSQLWSAQQIDPERVKPTAEVLASLLPTGDVSRKTPGLLQMRYGAGRSLYVGFDETWRWRYARGEQLFERFWIPLIRSLGREALSRGSNAAVLRVTPGRAEIDAPIRVELLVNDQLVLEDRPPSIDVVLVREDGSGSPVELSLPAERLGGDRYSASVVLQEPGAYRVEVSEALLSGSGSASIEVVAPQDEFRTTEADHERLASLSAATSGRVLAVGELDQLAELLPNRARRVPIAPDLATLWDKPAALILLLSLLLGEWLGRRTLRLL